MNNVQDEQESFCVCSGLKDVFALKVLLNLCIPGLLVFCCIFAGKHGGSSLMAVLNDIKPQ